MIQIELHRIVKIDDFESGCVCKTIWLPAVPAPGSYVRIEPEGALKVQHPLFFANQEKVSVYLEPIVVKASGGDRALGAAIRMALTRDWNICSKPKKDMEV